MSNTPFVVGGFLETMEHSLECLLVGSTLEPRSWCRKSIRESGAAQHDVPSWTADCHLVSLNPSHTHCVVSYSANLVNGSV